MDVLTRFDHVHHHREAGDPDDERDDQSDREALDGAGVGAESTESAGTRALTGSTESAVSHEADERCEGSVRRVVEHGPPGRPFLHKPPAERLSRKPEPGGL